MIQYVLLYILDYPNSIIVYNSSGYPFWIIINYHSYILLELYKLYHHILLFWIIQITHYHPNHPTHPNHPSYTYIYIHVCIHIYIYIYICIYV